MTCITKRNIAPAGETAALCPYSYFLLSQYACLLHDAEMDESSIRASVFFAVFAMMVVAEGLAPRRRLRFGYRRWPANLLIVLINSLLVRLLPVAGAGAVAQWAELHHFGLFHLMAWPPAIALVCAVVLLDLAIYAQHRLFHAVPVLWRLHQVHHADRDIDVTTGLRFHPFEILLSMLIKMAVVALLGASVPAVLLFEVILNGMAMFNHANFRLPVRADAVVRRLFVTPDMHRVHHSVIRRETNSNYGFNLSLWDRLFATYHAQPEAGHDAMTIGLAHLQSAPTHSLTYMLCLPFSGEIGQYPSLRGKSRLRERDDV
ncbi:sterol desaturase family protein [Mariprofundus ferrooxydans]|uniref:sterol desaturase family protein n=1 Tax=Mariprofundus ferrooxydans TaxID=314344 RepID=UPI00038086DF